MADRVYLDTCVIQRPLDTAIDARTALEAEAVLALLPMFASGELALISSDVLVDEGERNLRVLSVSSRKGMATIAPSGIDCSGA